MIPSESTDIFLDYSLSMLSSIPKQYAFFFHPLIAAEYGHLGKEISVSSPFEGNFMRLTKLPLKDDAGNSL